MKIYDPHQYLYQKKSQIKRPLILIYSLEETMFTTETSKQELQQKISQNNFTSQNLMTSLILSCLTITNDCTINNNENYRKILYY